MADSDDPARGDRRTPGDRPQGEGAPPRDDDGAASKDSPGMPGGTLGTGGAGRDQDR